MESLEITNTKKKFKGAFLSYVAKRQIFLVCVCGKWCGDVLVIVRGENV